MRRRIVLWSTGIVLTILVCAVSFLVTRKVKEQSSPSAVSSNLIDLLVKGDSQRVSEYLPESELLEMGITRKESVGVIAKVIVPYCLNYSLESMAESGMDPSSMRGDSYAILSSKETGSFKIGLSAHRTKDKPVVKLRQLLVFGWQLGLSKQKGSVAQPIDAMAWGLKKDLILLESLGITKLASNESGKPPELIRDKTAKLQVQVEANAEMARLIEAGMTVEEISDIWIKEDKYPELR